MTPPGRGAAATVGAALDARTNRALYAEAVRVANVAQARHVARLRATSLDMIAKYTPSAARAWSQVAMWEAATMERTRTEALRTARERIGRLPARSQRRLRTLTAAEAARTSSLRLDAEVAARVVVGALAVAAELPGPDLIGLRLTLAANYAALHEQLSRRSPIETTTRDVAVLFESRTRADWTIAEHDALSITFSPAQWTAGERGGVDTLRAITIATIGRAIGDAMSHGGIHEANRWLAPEVDSGRIPLVMLGPGVAPALELFGQPGLAARWRSLSMDPSADGARASARRCVASADRHAMRPGRL